MSIFYFRLSETAERRLKFSNNNKTENQVSLRLAPERANAIETYKVHETENENQVQNWQFMNGLIDYRNNFRKITGASAYTIRHLAITELVKLDVTERNLATFIHYNQKFAYLSSNTVFTHPQKEPMTQQGN
ncbi:MAG: hypothetical protein EZS28_026847 [Streblomastix strix]|uniref:Uncharacterized protein n=1 Tax=Streblomastix strix TaxID=222440 RepID=A0A5J4V6B3_9EUKA|nr:MAG: hypothetical protein EZS28_026847 [Streblomastix strix]